MSKCIECAYWSEPTECCMYVSWERKTRGCPPGDPCIVYLPRTEENMQFARRKDRRLQFGDRSHRNTTIEERFLTRTNNPYME